MALGETSITEVMARAEKAHSHFFDKDTMRFFQSRASETCYIKGTDIYFITSEKQKSHWSEFDQKVYHFPRLFTVRKCDKDGDIDTIGDFQAYDSLRAARKAIKDLFEIDTTLQFEET